MVDHIKLAAALCDVSRSIYRRDTRALTDGYAPSFSEDLLVKLTEDIVSWGLV